MASYYRNNRDYDYDDYDDYDYGRRRYRRQSPILTAIILCAGLYYALFMMTFDHISCNGTTCDVTVQHGVMGSTKTVNKFYQSDVESYDIGVSRNVKHSKNDYYHDDYFVYFNLKDGQRIKVKKKFCENKSSAETFAEKVKNGRSVSH